jgi:3-oxoacyl-[acyl-carrier protein] reductase
MERHLSGKTALVTGASRGIGRACAAALARAGARVIVHYGKAEAEADSLVADIRSAGGTADAVQGDMAPADGPAHVAAKVKAIAGERLDIVVANAGIAGGVPIEQQTLAGFDELWAVNVRAPYFLIQQVLPLLGEGSSVIFMSSLAARALVGELSAYAATKGAISTLVTHLAPALGSRGIRVNAVAPGVIDTELSGFVKTEAGRAYTFNMQALKRIGQPEDVADVVTFLAGDGARWITGVTIPVDGGSKL